MAILATDLRGRTALVTGASSGFGAHFGRVLAAAGMHVVLTGRRVDALQAAASAITAEGGRATPMAMDVTDPGSISSVIEAASTLCGRIDVLVNNAGVTISKAALDHTEADFDQVLDTDLKGAFLVATETARHMGSEGGGSIINIASILGLRQAGHVSAYAIAKAGVIQMTKSLALELARIGVRVNAIAPGYFNTDLNRDFLATDAGQALIKRVPSRRLGELQDLDGPLLLLASDASAHMTGAVLVVDGGHMVSTL